TCYFSESSAVKVAQGASGDAQDKDSVKRSSHTYTSMSSSLQDISVCTIADLLEG
ncbi:hypothetical protein DFH29DRAFT_757396, partial [Suillus ampliporus]